MAIDRDIEVWLPGVTKESSGFVTTDTAIIFNEDVIHPSSQNPFANVGTDEEDILNFSYYFLTGVFEHFKGLPSVDRPAFFDIRRNYFSNESNAGLSVTFNVTIPLETSLLFGRKDSA